MKTTPQDKLRPKALPCFFIGPSANLSRDTFEVLIKSVSIIHSRSVTKAWLPPSVPVSAENVRSVSVSGNEGKLHPSRDGVVEEDVDVDLDESSESAGVRSSVNASLVAPTPADVPCGRATPVGGRGTTAGTSFRVATIEEVQDSSVQSSAGTPGGFATSTPSGTSVGVNASGGTASPGASVESSPYVSEEDEADDIPSSGLGGLSAS